MSKAKNKARAVAQVETPPMPERLLKWLSGLPDDARQRETEVAERNWARIHAHLTTRS